VRYIRQKYRKKHECVKHEYRWKDQKTPKVYALLNANEAKEMPNIVFMKN
jgi:hypothetical protein